MVSVFTLLNVVNMYIFVMVFEKKITLNNPTPLEEENIDMTNCVLHSLPPPAGLKGVATLVQ